MAYKGRYKPKNIEKYDGDPDNVVYRSAWERQAFKWLDENPKVVRWGSETVIVPYLSEVDNKIHRYFTDLVIEFTNGEVFLVEIKPESQTKPPKKSKTGKQTRRYLKESMTYIKNKSKWSAAREYANKRGWKFFIWTEKELKSLGIRLVTK